MNEEIINDKCVNISIDNEIKECFLDYSMSVIVSRAIPDVRDGLKPVHRRLLYTFYSEGITYDKPHKKVLLVVVKYYNIILMVMLLFTILWPEWPKILHIDIL